MFWSKIFYGWKIFSSEIDFDQKFSIKIFLVENFLFAKLFLRKQVLTKKFHQQFLLESVLWLGNDFLGNTLEPKIYGRNFFMVAKSFTREEDLTKNFHQKFFG